MLTKKTTSEKPADDKQLKIIKQTTKKLIELIGLKKAKIKVDQDSQKTIQITISNTDLDKAAVSLKEIVFSLQLVLSLLVYKKLGQWQNLIVDIDGWRQKREEELKKLALNSAQKVKFSGQEIVLSQLNPAERRIIHLTLADSQEVETESKGEGDQRLLVIKPKKDS